MKTLALAFASFLALASQAHAVVEGLPISAEKEKLILSSLVGAEESVSKALAGARDSLLDCNGKTQVRVLELKGLSYDAKHEVCTFNQYRVDFICGQSGRFVTVNVDDRANVPVVMSLCNEGAAN